MTYLERLKSNPIPWLLENDSSGVRPVTMRDLLDVPAEDAELRQATRDAHQNGPIARVLSHMEEPGFWVKPGPGYGPKYKSSVWSILLLAQLGSSVEEDPRVRTACNYILDQALAPGGQFAYNAAPGGTIDCLQGNLCWSLLQLGCEDPRLELAFEWMARSVTGEGVAPSTDKKNPNRYYAYKCGPVFACGANGKMPCAWGAAKVMLAFCKLPRNRRTPLIQDAIQTGVDFFFGVDPASADYPTTTGHPSRNWWKFGFPVFYITDLLQIVESLVFLGYGGDPRLKPSLDLILAKQDEQGRWPLEYEYTGKTWGSYGKINEPNKWVTLRVLRMLKAL
jgi:hypothetical protein